MKKMPLINIAREKLPEIENQLENPQADKIQVGARLVSRKIVEQYLPQWKELFEIAPTSTHLTSFVEELA